MANKVEIQEKFARMWKKSRNDAGKSQEYVAKALGVSKRTVQNWEEGISCPNQMKGFEWFSVLGLQPLPYYLEILFDTENENNNELDEILTERIRSLDMDSKKELLFLLCGEHGSSLSGLLQLITAHLHTPLRDRMGVAQMVLMNYEIALEMDKTVAVDYIQPKIELLENSIKSCKESVYRNEEGYSII